MDSMTKKEYGSVFYKTGYKIELAHCLFTSRWLSTMKMSINIILSDLLNQQTLAKYLLCSWPHPIKIMC